MGLYRMNCSKCDVIFSWFSGDKDQRCGACRHTNMSQEKKLSLLSEKIEELKVLNNRLFGLIQELEDYEKQD